MRKSKREAKNQVEHSEELDEYAELWSIPGDPHPGIAGSIHSITTEASYERCFLKWISGKMCSLLQNPYELSVKIKKSRSAYVDGGIAASENVVR